MPESTEDTTAVSIRRGEQSTELIVDALDRVVSAAEELLATGLSDRGLVLLLNDLTGVGKRDIQRVLDALPELRTFIEDGET